MNFTRKSAFSMVEMLMIVIVLAVGMTTLIIAMNYGIGFTQKTRQKIIAVNLAREGMESIYNLRDTNWNLRAGQKEECWLNKNPFESLLNDSTCTDDDWFASGFYVLEEKIIDGQKYFALTGDSLPVIDLSDGIETAELVYSLCQSGQTWSACPYSQPASSEGTYFRQIVGLGLYDKDTTTVGGDYLDCSVSTDLNGDCSDGKAKEFRFCSRVYYAGDGYGMIELCGVMTNFAE